MNDTAALANPVFPPKRVLRADAPAAAPGSSRATISGRPPRVWGRPWFATKTLPPSPTTLCTGPLAPAVERVM
eukprot:365771-Chlamydomonas_euryale.AAC.10